MSTTVNMHEAKSTLSRLVEAIEMGREQEIIIARNGRPIARLLPMAGTKGVQRRIGVAKGLVALPDDMDRHSEAAAKLFLGEAV